jgi:hypothetical protein
MTPNLQAWLSPYANNMGRLWANTGTPRQLPLHCCADLEAAGVEKWPNSVLRRSFASYHLARYQDASRLALDMGHVSPHMIFSNYREIVTPEEAEQYWQIFPPAPAENVVPMAQAS